MLQESIASNVMCGTHSRGRRKKEKSLIADGDPQHEIANVRALWHLHPHSGKLHLYIKISWFKMLTISTHKLKKKLLQTVNDYLRLSIWTNNCHHPNSQQENLCRGVKMTTAFWVAVKGEKQDLHYPAARFNERGSFLLHIGDALRNTETLPSAPIPWTEQIL